MSPKIVTILERLLLPDRAKRRERREAKAKRLREWCKTLDAEETHEEAWFDPSEGPRVPPPQPQRGYARLASVVGFLLFCTSIEASYEHGVMYGLRQREAARAVDQVQELRAYVHYRESRR